MYDRDIIRTETFQHYCTSLQTYHIYVIINRIVIQLDLDDFNVENAYFQSFEAVVRHQLDPVWHKVAPKTKQLVNDLGTLCRLLR
jgi:hypothetical protein